MFDIAPLMSSFLIILREGFEAMLIVMLIFAYIKKFKANDKAKYVWFGIIVAIASSIGIAIGFTTIAGLTHEHEELFEGVTMLAAAGMLTYVAYWCHNAGRIFETSFRNALTTGTAMALGVTVCLAILREGFEIVLFYAALFSSDIGINHSAIITGALLGIVALGIVYMLMRMAIIAMPTTVFFNGSKYFLLGLAIYFAYEGGHELMEVYDFSLESIMEYRLWHEDGPNA